MGLELSRDAVEKIEKMVERVARKAGYTEGGTKSSSEVLKEKMTEFGRNIAGGFAKAPVDTDFAEEIRTYLMDGIADLMKEGKNEKEAVEMTMAKFDTAEQKDGFDGFAKEFNWFGTNDVKGTILHYTLKAVAIGLVNWAFILLGMTAGALIGYLNGHTIVYTLIGTGVGLFIGIGLGTIAGAIILLQKRSKSDNKTESK